MPKQTQLSPDWSRRPKRDHEPAHPPPGTKGRPIMASYNKVFLMGNLTRDPQVKHLPSQMVLAEFGLAVNRRYKTATGEDKEEVAFVDCTAFGRQAETIGQYCTKGKPIFVEGRLKFDTWDDRHGGGKRSKLTVVVENFQFLGRPMEAEGNGPGNVTAGNPHPGSGAPPVKNGPPAAEQQKMFSGEDRKWRGGNKSAERQPRNRQAAAGAKPGSPVSEDQQFDEADIPF
jgi:single-strand DNA-binding protein